MVIDDLYDSGELIEGNGFDGVLPIEVGVLIFETIINITNYKKVLTSTSFQYTWARTLTIIELHHF